MRSVHLMRNLVQEKKRSINLRSAHFTILHHLRSCFLFYLLSVLSASHFHCSIYDAIFSSHLRYIYIALEQYKQSSYCIQSLLAGDSSIFVFLLVFRSHRHTHTQLHKRGLCPVISILFLVLVVQMGIY